MSADRLPCRAALLLSALLIVTAGRVQAQGCCSPGSSPLGGLGGTALPPGSVEAGLLFDDYRLNQAYRGSERIEAVNDRREQVTRWLAFARVGLPAQATLIVEWPYESRSRDQTIRTESQELSLDFRNRAPGDLSTLLVVRAFPRGVPAPWGVDAGIGVKWATGPVNRSDGGMALPVEMQSGSGSTDPLFFAGFHRTWPATSMELLSLVRWARRGRHGYRFGSETNIIAGGARTLRPWISVGVEARFRHQARDEIAGRNPPNSGGWRLSAGPRVSAAWSRARLGFEGALLLPLHQDLNGTQLGVSRQFLAGLRWAN
jgi:hypothetical protein